MGACNSKNNDVVDQETTIDQLAQFGDVNAVQGGGHQPGPVDQVAAGQSVQFLNPAMDPSGFYQQNPQPAGSVMGGGPPANPVELGAHNPAPSIRAAGPSDYFNGKHWETMSQAQAACDRYNQRVDAQYPGSSLFHNPAASAQAVNGPNLAPHVPSGQFVLPHGYTPNPEGGVALVDPSAGQPAPSAGGKQASRSGKQASKSGKKSSGKAKKKKASKGKKKKTDKAKKKKSKKTSGKKKKSKK